MSAGLGWLNNQQKDFLYNMNTTRAPSHTLDLLLKEEKKILDERKKSQENRKGLNESDEIDLLSYNEYIANARVARK